MDLPEATVTAVGCTPPPPSYTEAVQTSQTPSTPPPSYGEAVWTPDLHSDSAASPYPILSIPTVNTPIHHTQQVLVQPSPQQVVPQQRPVYTLSNAPTVIVCPYCNQQVTTKVKYKPGFNAWFICCMLTLFGLVCGCCLIPFCVRECQESHHTCPHCKGFLGIHTH